MSVNNTRFDICEDVDHVLKIGREFADKDGYHGAHYDTVKLLCDTIEHLRESSNNNVMRKALEHVGKLAREFAAGNYYVSDFPKMLLDVIHPALTALPRNCDVGTPDEQYNRFIYCCTERKIQCRKTFGRGCAVCYAKWLQMTYEKEETE